MAGLRARSSDEAAELEALVERYGVALRSFIARRLYDRSEAADLAQEVFLRLLKRRQDAPIDNIEGYLFQIAANLLRERGRQTASRAAAPAIELSPELLGEGEEHSPERILLGKEAYRQVLAALQELPERTRTVFILSRFEDLTGAEIARRLGVSASAVEKHMMRALQHLRQRTRP